MFPVRLECVNMQKYSFYKLQCPKKKTEQEKNPICWGLLDATQLLKVPLACRFGKLQAPSAAQHPRLCTPITVPSPSRLPTDHSQSQPQPWSTMTYFLPEVPSQNRGPSWTSGEITLFLFFPDPLPFVPWNGRRKPPGDTAPFSQWIPHRISCSSARASANFSLLPFFLDF